MSKKRRPKFGFNSASAQAKREAENRKKKLQSLKWKIERIMKDNPNIDKKTATRIAEFELDE